MFNPDNKMLIAMAKGTSKNIKMKAGEMSFREFGKFCSKAQQGGKHESYFTRGVPEVEEEYQSKSGREYYNGRFRHDISISNADFIIIDADNSVSSPSEVHEQLDKLDYAHFIYTSHSHGNGSNNFRVVIPCSISSKKYMVATAKSIIKLIKGVHYVTEMGVWSQAWYLPTRDDIDDGVFEYYEYMEGTEFLEVQEEQKVESDASKTGNLVEDVQSMAKMIQIITTGAEGMHHAIKSYSYGAIQDGQNRTVVKETLRGLMMACPNQDSRWQDRFNDIDRLVDGITEGESDDLVIIENDEVVNLKQKKELNWPPGLMGEFSKSMYKAARYPNRVMACTTPLAIIAGVAGRSFNISNMGLNIYLTYLMNSGGGKNHIGQFSKRILNSGIMSGGSSEFLLGNEFSGAKALLDELYDKRCGLSIQNESGFKRAKKSGDQSGLQGQILQLFSSSGRYDISDVMMYSDSKNNTRSVQAPCMSIVEESTPNMYLDALKDGSQTGQLNRMYIFRCGLESTKMNRQAEYKISQKVESKIIHLMAKCKDYQRKDDPESIEFNVTDDMYDFADDCKYTSEQDNMSEENPSKFSMLQRSHEKAWKVACLITIFNNFIEWDRHRNGSKGGKGGNGGKGSVNGSGMMDVDKDAWEWAKELHEYEMEGLEEFFKRSGDSDIDELISSHVLRPFIKLLQPKGSKMNTYGDKRQQLRKLDRDKNQIPWNILRRTFRNCRAIGDLGNAAYGKSGLDVILGYMENNGYIKIDKGSHITIKQSFFNNFGVE